MISEVDNLYKCCVPSVELGTIGLNNNRLFKNIAKSQLSGEN